MWSLTGSSQRNTYALSDQKYSHGHLNAAGESKTSLGEFFDLAQVADHLTLNWTYSGSGPGKTLFNYLNFNRKI